MATDHLGNNQGRPLKPRATALYYIALLASGGLFVFGWIYLLMRDVNVLLDHRFFRPKLYLSALLILLFITILGVLDLAIKGSERWDEPSARALGQVIMIAAALNFIGTIAIIAFLQERIRSVSGQSTKWYHVLSILILSFLWYLSLPYLQLKLNRIGRRGSTAGAQA